MTVWPRGNPELIDDELETRWQQLIRIRIECAREIEKLRQAGTVGSGLEAQVSLYTTDSKLKEFLSAYQNQLPMILIVSDVLIAERMPADAVPAVEMPDLHIKVERSPYRKCARCWQYQKSVGELAEHPTICRKCLNALQTGRDKHESHACVP
jgi:isoleucyl-tRNA synthetase